MTSVVRAESVPTAHTTLWTPENRPAVEIPFALTNEQEYPEAIFFTGFGEVDVGRIAKELGDHGLKLAVVNLCIPTEGKKTVSAQYRQDIVNSVAAVRRGVLAKLELPPSTKIGVAGNSAGAGEVIVGAGANPHQWRWAILLSPLGGAIQSAGAVRRGLLDEAGRHAEGGVALTKELTAKFHAGMVLFSDSNGPQEIKALARELPLVATIAQKDRIIPYAQMIYCLGGVTLALMEGKEHISCLGKGADDTADAYKFSRSIVDGLLRDRCKI